MGIQFRQTNFAGGQLGPQLLGRTDVQQYASGLRKATNCTITRYGGVENRAGTLYDGPTKFAANTVQTIPFVFNFTNSYLLEVGATYIRIWKDGAPLSVVGSVTWTPGRYIPTGAVVQYLGNYYYRLSENKNITTTTLTISGGPPWTAGSAVLLTASTAIFSPADVGNQFTLYDAAGNLVTARTTSYISTTQLTATLFNDAPADLQNVATANWSGTTVPSNAPPWYLLPSTQFEIPVSIPQAAIGAIVFAQVNDILTMTNQLFSPLQVLRFGDLQWIVQPFAVSAGINPPDPVSVIIGVSPAGVPAAPTAFTAAGGNGGTAPVYTVTAYTTSGEGFTATPATATVGEASVGFPVVLTWTPPAGTIIGYAIYKSNGTSSFGIIATTHAATYTDVGITDNIGSPEVHTAPLNGPPGSTIFTYLVTAIDAITGAESLASLPAIGTGGTPDSAHPNVISWPTVLGTNGVPASKYNIYSVVNGVPGFIGSQLTSPFNDINYQPNTAIQPPTTIALFATSNDWPACVAYYQQRILFGNTINQPQTVKGSRAGQYSNFNVSTPVVDTDALSFTIAGTQVQPIQSMVDMGKLLIHTASSEYLCAGNQSGALTPLAINCTLQGSSGSSPVQPVVIGNSDIFVQASGQIVRDLRYEVQNFSYTGTDLTRFAPDLFIGRTVVAMAWQQVKDSIIWVVMSDGQLLSMTFIKEGVDKIYAWTPQDLQGGFVEWISVVPEGSVQTIYVVVRRVINGATVRYLEQIAQRDFIDTQYLSDAIFCDSAQRYDGRNSDSSHTITATSVTGGWTEQDQIRLTANFSAFVSGDVGNTIVLDLMDGTAVTTRLYFPIMQYTSATVVLSQPTGVVPAWAQAQPIITWGKAVHTFINMSHLEGQELSLLGDGQVLANPQDTSFPVVTVSGGTFTTPANYNALVLCAGLPMLARVQTMPPENQRGDSIIGKKKKVTEIVATLYQTTGAEYGTGEQTLDLLKWRALENYANPNALFTGSTRLTGVRSTWNYEGDIVLQQSNPLPMGISALITDAEVGN